MIPGSDPWPNVLGVAIELTADQRTEWIGDDGCGFSAGELATFAAGGREGLASMRDRARELGGTFTVQSAPNDGTVIVARLPLPPTTGG